MKDLISVAIIMALLSPPSSLASHGIYKQPRRSHNRLNIPREQRSIHNEPPSYSIGSIGTTYPAKRTEPALQDGWNAGGCIYDSANRVMREYGVKSLDNTPASCIATCEALGYSYAGVEHGDECWCSKGFVDGEPKEAGVEECNMECSSDPSLACGGGYRMLWFSKGPIPPGSSSSSPSSQSTDTPLLPAGWSHFERVQDRAGSNRLLPAFMFISATMTPTQCIDTCAAKGFQLAGVEDGSECWCDNAFNTKGGEVQTFQDDDDECGKSCPGDHQQVCGDGWVMDVYRFGSLSKQSLPLQTLDDSNTGIGDPTWVVGPCMSDRQPDRLLSSLQLTYESLSHQKCLELCSSLNLDIAGLQNGDECWCSDVLNLAQNEQPSTREVDLSECGAPCGAGPFETCGGPLKMLLFSRNSALDKYNFGFTRPGESLTMASSPPVSPDASSDITLPVLSVIDESTGSDGIKQTLGLNDDPVTSDATGVVTDILDTPVNPGVIGQPTDLTSYPLAQGPLSSLDPTTGIDPSNLNPDTGSESIARKKVLAHHIVGNTYPYTLNTWLSDIKLAKAAGIDAFVLNFGEGGYGGWQRARMRDAFKAAEMVGGFGMIFSFDMSVLPCGDQNDAGVLRDYLRSYGTRAGHLTIPPAAGSNLERIVVSTFAGEYCTFGTGSVHDGWLSVAQDSGVVSHLREAGREIAFVPAWFARIESRRQEFGGVVQGDFHWNGGWPTGDNDINFDTDIYHMRYNPGPLYMASVSPWFFTHYGADSFNKNFMYRGDDWLYASRWESLIDHRAQVDLAQIVTWNDYGESSYIGPIEGDQPHSQAWVNGYPHLGFLDMTSYYAKAYKTGAYPTIAKDKVYIWSRPHPRDANVPQDSVGRPTHAEWTDDYVWGLVMSTRDGEFTLTSGHNSQTFPVVAGVNKFKVPNSPGTIRGTLSRDGVRIVDVKPGSKFLFTPKPSSYNFNNFMASN